MIMLKLMATVAAVTTITLNAHHGWKQSAVIEYAVLFAILNGALDVAKCALIPAASHAFRQRHYLIAVLALVLFVPLLAYSVSNAVSQVLITRDAGKAQAVADHGTRTRIEADHRRLTSELATMQASPTFTASAACALPKSKEACAYCTAVDATRAALAIAASKLAANTVTDPAPQVTILAVLTGRDTATITFGLAVLPVILAELVGSLGFYLASIPKSDPTAKPVRTPLGARLRSCLGSWRPASKTPPAINSGATTGILKAAPPANGAAPTLTWPIQPVRQSP